MFNIDLYKIIPWLLPFRYRVVFNIEYIRVLLTPLVTIYNNLLTLSNTTRYRVQHTGQVCYITGALNDAFDITNRGIKVRNSGGDNVILLNTDADVLPLMVHNDTTEAIALHNDSAYTGSQYDFIVVLPREFEPAERYRLEAVIDYYKLAGKRPDIITETKKQ